MVNLYPHQSNTIRYLEAKCTNQHGLLVFHHMGTGKTATAVGWLINRKLQHVAVHGEGSSAPPFKYRIVCPELIKQVWTGPEGDPHKMGLDVDPECVKSYKEFEAELISDKATAADTNVVFDEAHHLVPIMRTEENKYYVEVMRLFKKASKVLLLTGTPEQRDQADFMYLVNVVAGRTEFPVDYHQLVEKYRDLRAFEARKKNFYFNWVAPHVRDIFNFCFHQLVAPYITSVSFAIISRFVRFPRPPIGWFGLEESDFADDNHSDREESESEEDLHTLSGVRKKFTRTVATVRSVVPTSVADVKHRMKTMMLESCKMHMKASYEGTSAIVQWAETTARGLPGNRLVNTLLGFAMSSMMCMEVTNNPEEAIANSDTTDFAKMANDIGRYVSFYRIPEESRDFATIKQAPTVESPLDQYQSLQQLHFVYGTMPKSYVQYYAGVDEDSANIKMSAFRELQGVRKYGRCISNMSKQLVSGYVDGTLRSEFSTTDGTFHYVDAHNESRVQTIDGCAKFKLLVAMLREATAKGERCFVRSEFTDQGVRPLSAFLNSEGIRHFYYHTGLSAEERARILTQFNDVYRSAQIDGKPGWFMDYVASVADLHYESKQADHLSVGMTVYVQSMKRKGMVVEWSGADSGDIRDGSSDGRDGGDGNQSSHQVGENIANRLDVFSRGPTKAPTLTELHVQFDDETTPHPTPFPVRDLQRLWRVRHRDSGAISYVESERIQLDVAEDKLHAPGSTHKHPQIILFDSEGSEGINLLGVEHVHLLEPMLNIGERDQAVARAVRFQSHRHLHPSRNVVHVHTHIGVMHLSSNDMRRTGEMLQSQVRSKLLAVQKENFLTKNFAGIVPRTGNFFWDWWMNSVETLHGDMFNGKDTTPDMLVMSRLNKSAKYQGHYESEITKTNVLAHQFRVPSDCEAADEVVVKTSEFKPLPKSSRPKRSRRKRSSDHGSRTRHKGRERRRSRTISRGTPNDTSRKPSRKQSNQKATPRSRTQSGSDSEWFSEEMASARRLSAPSPHRRKRQARHRRRHSDSESHRRHLDRTHSHKRGRSRSDRKDTRRSRADRS